MSWFANARMSVKLLSGFCTIAIIAIIAGVIGTSSLHTVNDADSRLFAEATRPLGVVEVLSSDFQRTRGTLRDVAMRPHEAAQNIGRFVTETKTLAAVAQRLDSMIVDTTLQRDVDVVTKEIAAYSAASEKVVTLVKEAHYNNAEKLLYSDETAAQGKTTEASIDTLVAHLVATGQRIADDNDRITARATIIQYAVTAFTAILAVLLGLVIARVVTRPLQETVAVLKRVADGDLTVRSQVDSRDEIGQMAAALNQAVAAMDESIGAIAQNAQALAASSEELSAVSLQMGANAEQTSSQAGVVSAAAEEVSKNVQTVAAGAEEMSASIKEIASNASQAAQVATGAVRAADETNAVVTKLGDSSQEIGAVIKVITSIAEQTNLLALNATIEAARAGEAGKGFAVVANEVKELAKETAKATEDIARKVQAIQNDTTGAVTAIGEIATVIRQINDISGTIASAVEEQAATTNEIGRNVTEAARGAGEIAENITGVANASTSTSQGAQNAQQAAGDLARMAAELQRLVSRFQFAHDVVAAGAPALRIVKPRAGARSRAA
jgi:methyl-accepting chemotaxis protein